MMNQIYYRIRTYLKEQLIIQKFISAWKTRKLYKYYSCSNNNIKYNLEDKTIIFMVDGHTNHGGLCDRLNGLVSTFLFCKENGLKFKVWWKYPFDLELFLLPNKYNWHLSKISYDINISKPYHWGTIHNTKNQFRLANKLIKINAPVVHAYTNMHYKREKMPDLFKYLFIESPLLSESINKNSEQLGKSYISVTYRFQQLLGDFKEGNFPILDNQKDILLINKCLDYLETIKKNHPGVTKLLVTSDSPTFLKKATERYEFVHIINGESVHMDFIEKENNPYRHLKPFVELMLISHATKCFFVRTPETYPSSFAKTGALIGGISYNEVFIDF